MKYSRFDSPTFARIFADLFRSGRRTVSYRDIQQAFGRDFDHALESRIIAALPVVAKILEREGMFCTLVNAFCVSNYSEVAISDDPAIAQRCNVFNSGGKLAVGLRIARPDDLVRAEVPGSLGHLSGGGLKSARQADLDNLARGLATPDTIQRHHRQIQDTFKKVNELEASPDQPQLPE